MSSAPANYNASAYACFVVFIVVTTSAVIARAVSRKIQKAPFWFDDALVYTSWVTNTASLITCLNITTLGAFNLEQLAAFTPAQMAKYQTLNLTVSVIYILTITCSKLSVLFLFRRIFGMNQPWFKVSWWLNLLLICPCWSALTLAFVIWVQLDSFAFSRKSNSYGAAVVTLINAVSDMLVLILPIRCVLNLQLSTKRKVEVLGLFSLGLLATLVSLSRAILSFYQVRNGTAYWNPAYTGFNFTVLALAEPSAAILCACTPVIRPFFIKVGQVASQSMSSDSLRAMLSKRRTSSRSASGDSNDSTSLEKEAEKDKNTITRTIAVDLYSIPQQQADFRATDDFGGVKRGARPAAAMGWA